MNIRNGAEGFLGLGGGYVAPESQEYLQKAQEQIRKRNYTKAKTYLAKALKDGNNIDAITKTAILSPPAEAIQILEVGEMYGRQILQEMLGEDCFEDGSEHVGRFWLLLETRPYMRLLQTLVKLYFSEGRYEESAKTIIEILRLRPIDNLGQRHFLGSLLLRTERYADALSFCQIWMLDWLSKDNPAIERGGTNFKPPKRGFLTTTMENRLLLEKCKAHFLLTSAFASFKLWGDSDEARRYLRAGTLLNPLIMTKILAKVRQPTSLNVLNRKNNGPEEAQDYLYLTQDLWTQDDIWNWVNANHGVKNIILKKCCNPPCTAREKTAAEFQRCAGCHLVVYCSVRCQKADWKDHKTECKRQRMRKIYFTSLQTGKPLPEDFDDSLIPEINGMPYMTQTAPGASSFDGVGKY